VAPVTLGRTIPALPARDVAASVVFYRDRLGFATLHHDGGFAVVGRDDAVLHLWESSDESWHERDDLRERPVCSGAESFIAGTASCRIEVDDPDGLYDELRPKDVLHPVSREAVSATDFGTREFSALDPDGNLLTFYRWVIGRGTYTTISGKAFRPRPMDMGGLAWLLFGVCILYVLLAVVLPLAALIFTSLQRFATVILSQAEFTLANYQTALSLGPVRVALVNSLSLGFGVATVGVVLMAFLVWIIYRSKIVGRGVIEYLAMFPQAVPRLVFGLALLWAWLNIPIPIYGTLWLLALAYLTVMLPLGVRTLAGVVLQIDKSLEECARVCGAGWLYQMRTVTLPLLKPGILAAWLLIFMACVRELGASVFLMGPNAKVIAPSIVAAFASSGTELTAAMALIQTATVVVALIILFRLTRGATRELS